MPLVIARKLLPPSAIIGVSCTTPEHIRKTVEEGADYVGLGSVYTTSTKDVSASGKVCGIAGARAMLTALEGTGVKAVAIGTNHQLLLHHPPSPIPPPTLWHWREWHGMSADGRTGLFVRRHQIHESASHTAWLHVCYRSRPRWHRSRVRYRGVRRPPRGCLPPGTDVPRLGGSGVPRAYRFPGHTRTKSPVHARRNRNCGCGPCRHCTA